MPPTNYIPQNKSSAGEQRLHYDSEVLRVVRHLESVASRLGPNEEITHREADGRLINDAATKIRKDYANRYHVEVKHPAGARPSEVIVRRLGEKSNA